MKRNAILKSLRRKAESDTIGLPRRVYAMRASGQIICIKSTRARYLQLKRAIAP